MVKAIVSENLSFVLPSHRGLTSLEIIEDCLEKQLLIELVHQLKAQIKIKKDASTVELLDLLLDHIELYEKQTYPLRSMKPMEILSFLIEQHQLTQSDLPEVGSQSHVSKVLHGKRQLTLEQIIALSKRFNVSPMIFFSH